MEIKTENKALESELVCFRKKELTQKKGRRRAKKRGVRGAEGEVKEEDIIRRAGERRQS